MVFFKWLGIVFITASLCACNHIGLNCNELKAQKNSTLFIRIGGMPVITEIVDRFIDEVAASPRTKRSFDGIKLKALKESVTAQLCYLTGGGCVYEGETMLNSHRDAKITEAEFDAFVDMFRNTLNRYLPTKEKNELLKILAPMKRDIVTK
jgi:hemoglobin